MKHDTKYDDIILSKNYSKLFNPNHNNNSLVIASSGRGKTTSIVEAQLLHSFHNSIVFTFSKRKRMTGYVKLLSSRGYNIEYIDFGNSKRSTTGFDPIKYINSDKDIKTLAHYIFDVVKTNSSTNDRYWDDSSEDLLCAEIGLCFDLYKMNQDGYFSEELENLGVNQIMKKPTFNDVFTVHNNLSFQEIRGTGFTKSTLDNVFKEVEHWYLEKGECSQSVKWFSSIQGVAAKTVSCIFSNLNTTLDKVFTPASLEVINYSFLGQKKSIEFTDIGKQKTAFLIYSSPIDRSNDYFINILYTTLFKELLYCAEKQPDEILPVPVYIICDDFAVGCRLPDFPKTISIIRGFGIGICLLLQSYAQLIDMYGESGKQIIIDNCESLLYMGGMDIKTCEDISLKTNMPLEDILYMNPEKIWIISKQFNKPILDDRYPTYLDPIYLKIFNNDQTNDDLDEKI